jgi:hypothetical protein
MKDKKYHQIVKDSYLSRSEWEELIHQWCFNEKHRKMLAMNLLDGMSYMDIAEAVELSLQQTSTIMQREKKDFFAKVAKIINQ